MIVNFKKNYYLYLISNEKYENIFCKISLQIEHLVEIQR